MGLYRDNNGSVVEVDDAFAAGQGYTPANPAQTSADLGAQGRAEDTSLADTINAGATSALSGATLGISDLGLAHVLDDGQKQKVLDAQAAHPWATDIGQVAGVLGASLLGAGPVGAASDAVAATVEQGVARGGALGYGKAVAAMGAEGALQSAGAYLGQTALADKDMTAEGLTASLEHGFEFGAAGGAVGLGVAEGSIAVRRLYARYADGANAAEDAAIAFRSKAQTQFDADTAAAATVKQKLDDYKKATAAADRDGKYWDVRVAEEKAAAANPRKKTPYEPTYTDPDLGVSRGPYEEPGAGPAPDWVRRRNGQADAEIGPTERFGPDQEVNQPEKPEWIKRREGAEGPSGPAEVTGPREAEWSQRRRGTLEEPSGPGQEYGPTKADEVTPSEPNEAAQKAVESIDDGKKSIAQEPRDLNSPEELAKDAKRAEGRSNPQIVEWLKEKKLADEAVVGKEGMHDWEHLEEVLKEFNEARFGLDVLDKEGFNQVIKPRTNGVADDFLSAPGPSREVLQGERAEASASGFTRDAAMDDDSLDLPNIDDAKHASNFAEQIQKEATALTRYEKAAADMHDSLGDLADPVGRENTKVFREAESDAVRKATDRTARAVDDADTFGHDTKAPYDEGDVSPGEQRGPYETYDVNEPTPQERVRYAKERRTEAKTEYKKAKYEQATYEPTAKDAKKTYAAQKQAFRAETKAAAKGKSGIGEKGGMFANLAGLDELADIPGLPKLSDLPVIGPLLGAYLKFRLAKTAMGKLGLGGRITATVDAKVAATVAKMRDSVAKAVDISIGAAQAGGKAMQYTAPKLAGVLEKRLYDDGQPDAKGKGIQELVAVRTRELAAYTTTPGAIEKDVRKQLSGMTDPDVITAVEKQRRAQMEYLLKNAPTLPTPGILQKTNFVPGVAESMSWARRYQAARMPLDVFLAMQHEKAVMSLEAAETLKSVYPLMYQQAQLRLVERSAEIKASVPYQQRLRMSILYDVPLDSSMDPDNLALFQSSFAKPLPLPQPGAPAAPMPSIAGDTNMTALFQTSADRRSSR